MKIRVNLFIFVLIYFVTSKLSFAQTFTFADTHPVNNPDSLEKWLKEHPTPNHSRLQNFIALERSYEWQIFYRKNTTLDSIETLSKKLKSKVGMASWNYLKGIKTIAELKTVSYKYLSTALEEFEKINDISGQIHCNLKMAAINYDGNVRIIGEKKYAKDYLKFAQNLLNRSKNIHDQLMFYHILASLSYSSNKYKDLEMAMTNEKKLIQNNTSLEYGKIKAKISEALFYFTQNDFRNSASIYEGLLMNIKPSNYTAQMVCYYNLGNEYRGLGLYDKEADAYKKAIEAFLRSDRFFLIPLTQIYFNYRTNAVKKMDYQLANSLADSLIKYEKIRDENIKSNQMVELMSKNLLEKKEIEVANLEIKQKQLLIVIIISFFFLASVIFFFMRLRKHNKQIELLTKQREKFYTIVAHDLRGPIHGFTKLSESLNYLLKLDKKQELNNLVDHLEVQSKNLSQLADNLLYWGVLQNFSFASNFRNENLSNQLEDICHFYTPLLRTKNITLFKEIASDIMLNTDAKLINILVRNLLDNAVKYNIKNGSIFVQLKENLHDIEIIVENTGEAIFLEKMDSINYLLDKKSFGELSNGISLGINLIAKCSKKLNCDVNSSFIKNKIQFSVVFKKQ